MSLAKRINELGKEDDYAKSFDNAVNSAIKETGEPRVSRPNIKPSKAGCLRQMYYILKEYPVSGKESVNPDMYLIQQDGSYMHLVIQKILAGAKNQGLEFKDPATAVTQAQQMGIRTFVRPSSHDLDSDYEVTCYNEEFDISFKFDGALRFMKLSSILEIKNEDHFKFLKRAKPDPEHIFQGTFYSLCLGINHITFYYVGRNYKKRKAYLVEVTDEMRNEQIKRIRTVKYCALKDIIPMKENHKGCNYCSYKKQCKIDGDQTQEGIIDMSEVMTFELA